MTEYTPKNFKEHLKAVTAPDREEMITLVKLVEDKITEHMSEYPYRDSWSYSVEETLWESEAYIKRNYVQDVIKPNLMVNVVKVKDGHSLQFTLNKKDIQ